MERDGEKEKHQVRGGAWRSPRVFNHMTNVHNAFHHMTVATSRAVAGQVMKTSGCGPGLEVQAERSRFRLRSACTYPANKKA